VCGFSADAEQRLGTAVALEYVAEIGPSFPGLLRAGLKTLELGEAASDLEVRGALAPVAGGVGESEVVLGVEPVLDQGIDVIDV
jgi:hypothetical protein